MPEPTQGPRDALRRALEEGSRRLPHRVRELPNVAVRTAVIGVGKFLHVTAVARKEYDEVRRSGVGPTLDRLRRDGLDHLRPGVPKQSRTHTPTVAEPPPETGTPSAAEKPAAGTAAGPAEAPPAAATVAEPPEATVPEPPTPVEYPPADAGAPSSPATDAPARPVSGQDTSHLPEQSAAPPARDELPLPNYDELSLASLRARLRNLSITDLGVLLAYERTHLNRTNVVTMFENRILKLEREQGG